MALNFKPLRLGVVLRTLAATVIWRARLSIIAPIKRTLLLGFSAALFLFASGCFWATQEEEVVAMLKNSEGAWNQGDLPTFVSYFEHAPTTTTVDNSGVWRGDSAMILARYRGFYPTREKMGTIAFSEIDVRLLGDGLAVVGGKWSLKSTDGDGTASSQPWYTKQNPDGR